eukprot:CAMPEP_0113898988 /NCGR_PEP_ID=MMETSP0780_2-20120614/19736_1 /TAXON_ID=652834 /ORGANISM="Palpitomonas bilix" /LENGTH=368 /DNA_ID=CAMNT_0000891015 /DNA_START=162 /DNA_END=1269 /DNA_ORIENTATION=+ /assembly_acc=CAM_ASM_000599
MSDLGMDIPNEPPSRSNQSGKKRPAEDDERESKRQRAVGDEEPPTRGMDYERESESGSGQDDSDEDLELPLEKADGVMNEIGITDKRVRQSFGEVLKKYEKNSISAKHKLASSEGCLEPQASFYLMHNVPDLRSDRRVKQKLIDVCVASLEKLQREEVEGKLSEAAFKSYLTEAFGRRKEVQEIITRAVSHCKNEDKEGGGIKGRHTRTDFENHHFQAARKLLQEITKPGERSLGDIYDSLSQLDLSNFPQEKKEIGTKVLEEVKKDKSILDKHVKSGESTKSAHVRRVRGFMYKHSFFEKPACISSLDARYFKSLNNVLRASIAYLKSTSDRTSASGQWAAAPVSYDGVKERSHDEGSAHIPIILDT